MKKIISVLLSAAIGASLVACGENSSVTTAAPAAETKATAAGESSAAVEAGSATWPTGTVTFLCGFGAGGSSDLGVRALASTLEKQTGQSFVTQNVTGANGWLAWAQLLESRPDGNTIALVNTPSLFTDYLDPQQGHTETMDDFEFICNHVTDYGVLVAKKGKYADMAAFIEAAKAEGGVTVGDVGANGNKHIATLQLAAANEGTTITPVHQAGWSDNYAALLGDTLDAVSATYGDIASILADGEVDVLCVFAEEKLEALPEVPTCEEAGAGTVVSAPSRGYMLPKGIDPAVKEAIVAAFKTAIADEDHQKAMTDLGLNINYLEGQEYVDMLKGQEEDIVELKPALGWE